MSEVERPPGHREYTYGEGDSGYLLAQLAVLVFRADPVLCCYAATYADTLNAAVGARM